MNLRLTEEQSLIEASVRALLEGEYSFAQRRRSLDSAHGCRAELWNQFAEMGWLALPLPLEAGGLGGGALETGLLMRAFGRHLVVEPYHACVLAGRLIASMGRPEQRDAWLPGLMQGRLRLALAHEEAGQRDPWASPRTVAVRRERRWELTGDKLLARGAPGADALLVTAVVPAIDGQARRQLVFMLAPDTPGLVLRAARGADGTHSADLELRAVALDDDQVLGTGVDAGSALRAALGWALLALSWEAVGAMEATLEQTVAHARQRVQFGRPLIEFQVVAHRLAEMAVCREEALACCELAALRLDRGDGDAAELASMVKSKVGRAARLVAQQAVQQHGAMGVTEELPVASYFRRLTAYTQQGGSTDWHAEAYGQAQLRSGAWRHSRTLPATAAG